MLRWLVLALLLANLAFFAWTRGQADRTGREPDRHAQQVHPEAVQLLPREKTMPTHEAASSAELTASAASTAVAAPPSSRATRCLEAGPFSAAAVATTEAALAAHPAASQMTNRWTRVTAETPGGAASSAPLYRLRVEAATPDEATVLESLPGSTLPHGFAPCAPR